MHNEATLWKSSEGRGEGALSLLPSPPQIHPYTEYDLIVIVVIFAYMKRQKLKC